MADPFDKEMLNERHCHKKNYVYSIDTGVLSFHQSFVPKLKTLTHLDLSNAKLSALPEALCDLTALTFFQASNNQLTCLPSSFGQLKNLHELILSHNKLSSLPLGFADLSSLEVLNLSHNELPSVPACFQKGVVKIAYLDVSHNQLEDWDNGPMCGHSLTYLNCSNNYLRTNPSWLWGNFCRSLEELDLSFNLFSDASQVVKTYTLWRTGVTVKLKKLRIFQCGVSTPHVDLLHPLKALETLDLGNMSKEKIINGKRCYRTNFIWDISFKPFECRSVLTELSLGGLGMSALPDDINCLEVLEVLNCDGNRLQWLPDTFCELTKLRVAVFSNNKLLYLPDQFGKLSNLEELLLDSNEIGELPLSFSNLQSLKWLDLYKNRLENLPSVFETGLENLLGVDLELNYFDPLSSVNISSKPYTLLKSALHLHLHTRMNGKRIRRFSGLQKIDEYAEDLLSERASNDDLQSVLSESDSQDPEEDPDHNTSHDADEEDWDLEEGQDDYFDPTVKCTLSFQPMPARALIIHEVVIHAESFLPSDIHPSPSIRANKDPFLVCDGQFEDA